MNGPVPLSATSRSLLELGSEVRLPSSEQAERMRRALEPLFAEQPLAGSLPAAERPAPSAATARTWAARSKLLYTLGALAATASASFWLGRVSREAPQDPPASSLVAADQPRALAEAHPAPELLAIAPMPMPAPLRTAARQAPGAGGKPSRGRLAAEIAQLTKVEAALRQGRADAALRHLDARAIHELIEQSAALRAIAECSLGRRHAEQKARALLAHWRESAYQARVRDACGL